MKIRRTLLLIAIILFAVITPGLTWKYRDYFNTPPGKEIGESRAEPSLLTRPSLDSISGSEKARSSPGEVTKVANSNPFPEVPRSRRGLSLETDPFGATSIEEQRWLDTHGYPNEKQWNTYSIASEALLRQAAESGDSVASTMLDARLLPNDPTAKDRLLAAGAEGNLFALNSLAAFLTGSSKGDPLLGYAISRVSEIRGDVRIGMARDAMMPTNLSAEQKIAAEDEVIRINNSLNELYKEVHGSYPTISQRPTINSR